MRILQIESYPVSARQEPEQQLHRSVTHTQSELQNESQPLLMTALLELRLFDFF